MRGAVAHALTDSNYHVDDVVKSDLVLGYHELTGAAPVSSSIELGFLHNTQLIHLLKASGFNIG
jgi:hypothetical protein